MRTLRLLALSLLALAPAAAAQAPGEQRATPGPLANVGFLVLPGVYKSELMAPYDVLHHLRFHVKGAPEVFTVAPRPGTITTFEGLRLQPDYTFANAPPIDLLVVPSAEHNLTSDLQDERLIAWLSATGRRAKLLLSLCDGAFLLAQAGLLDGLEATTFPGDQDLFARTFPRVKLRRGVLFVHDGKAVTGEGGARSYEPALYLVERLWSAEAARRIAQGLVLDWDVSKLRHRRAPGATVPRTTD